MKDEFDKNDENMKLTDEDLEDVTGGLPMFLVAKSFQNIKSSAEEMLKEKKKKSGFSQSK